MSKLDIFFIICSIVAGLGAILVYRHDRRNGRKMIRITEISEIVGIFGSVDKLKRDIRSEWDVDQLIREGIPYPAFKHFQEKFAPMGFELDTFMGLESALKENNHEGFRLPSIASDRLYRLARLFIIATKVLEDEKSGAEWLKKPQWGLGGRIPAEVAFTEIGAKEVENLLGRIEHSVLA
ncbi:MAG TPA: antitoxin Xre/MbcA/ParS toxin-binding domain-containing protein [Syntrophales bacterium]|nr:antitoxin Xre/MbcA/ParS toxin-binding domain-containing protein [Syntrophales bacterium]